MGRRLAPSIPTATRRPSASSSSFVEAVAAGTLEVAPFASMSQSERFHWLTTPRSTLVQPGPLHAGMSDDPDATFDHLFTVLVSRS